MAAAEEEEDDVMDEASAMMERGLAETREDAQRLSEQHMEHVERDSFTNILLVAASRFVNAGDFAGAKPMVLEAMAAEDRVGLDHGISIMLLARVCSELGQHQKAAVAYDRALPFAKLSGDKVYARTLSKAVQGLAAIGNAEKVIELAEKSISLEHVSDAIIFARKAGGAYAGMRYWDRAIHFLKDALYTTPDFGLFKLLYRVR